MDVLDLLDEIIELKDNGPVKRPYGIGPSPLAGRKSLFGEAKDIQHRGRVARALARKYGREFSQYRDDNFRHRDADPEYEAIHQAASGGDEVAKQARDDYHEERGGNRLSHVHAASDRAAVARNRYGREHGESYARGDRTGRTRGTDQDHVRNMVSRVDRSTRENRRVRATEQSQHMMPGDSYLYSPPKQKSFANGIKSSPFGLRKALSAQNALTGGVLVDANTRKRRKLSGH